MIGTVLIAMRMKSTSEIKCKSHPDNAKNETAENVSQILNSYATSFHVFKLINSSVRKDGRMGKICPN